MNSESIINSINKICEINNWQKDWVRGGCYIHLEASEFIEALRGKGDKHEELGDLLFTIIAVADYYGLNSDKALEDNLDKHWTNILKELESEGSGHDENN